MGKWKIIIPTIMFLFFVGFVMACKENYNLGEEVIVFDIIETRGSGAECNISLYNKTEQIYDFNHTMQRYGFLYNISYGTNLSKGTYRSAIECVKDTSTYLGECNFIIESNKRMELAITIGLGILISFLVIFTITSKAIWLKILFGYGTLGFTLLETNVIKLMAESNGMEKNIIKMLATSYATMLWITITLISLGFVYGLYCLFMYAKDSLNKRNKRNLEFEF